jgi:hypothetical protein
VRAAQSFDMTITGASLRAQLAFARTEALWVADRTLRQSLLQRAEALEAAVKLVKRHQRGQNYAIVLERV